MERVLWEYFNAGRFVDCRVGGLGTRGREVYGCHRVVLAANSVFFDSYLSALDAAAAGADGETAATSGPVGISLPFPPTVVDAFRDVVPYLYDQWVETDIPLARTIPLLILACLIGVEPLAERLHGGLTKMCSGGVECAAVLALLAANPMADVDAALCAGAAGPGSAATATGTQTVEPAPSPGTDSVPYEARAVAIGGFKRAAALTHALYEHCVTTLVPLLHRLGQDVDVSELPPGPLLSVLRHPATSQQLRRDETSALVTKYLLLREATSASAVPDHLFSQLCMHVTDIPAVDITEVLKLAVRRNETTLLKQCMSAAVERGAWDTTPGLKSAVLDAFKSGVVGAAAAVGPEPRVEPREARAPAHMDHTLGHPEGPRSKRRRVAAVALRTTAPEGGGDGGARGGGGCIFSPTAKEKINRGDRDSDGEPLSDADADAPATPAPSCALFNTQLVSVCGTPNAALALGAVGPATLRDGLPPRVDNDVVDISTPAARVDPAGASQQAQKRKLDAAYPPRMIADADAGVGTRGRAEKMAEDAPLPDSSGSFGGVSVDLSYAAVGGREACVPDADDDARSDDFACADDDDDDDDACDRAFDEAVARTVESLSQHVERGGGGPSPATAADGDAGDTGDGSGHINAVLKRLHAVMVVHRNRRQRMCRRVINSTHGALAAKADYTAQHCDAMWAGVAQQQQLAKVFVGNALEGLTAQTQAAAAAAADMRSRLDTIEQSVAEVTTQCEVLRNMASRIDRLGTQQIQAAGRSTQHLLGVLQDDVSQSLCTLGRQVNAVADKNSTALKQLSTLLAHELAVD